MEEKREREKERERERERDRESNLNEYYSHNAYVLQAFALYTRVTF